MTFERVGEASEVGPGNMKIFVLKGTEVLVANVGGNYFAIANKCTHMSTNLSTGTLEGNILTCPKHGQKFDVTTGKSVQGPKVAFIKMKGKDEPSYRVKVDGKDLLVDLG